MQGIVIDCMDNQAHWKPCRSHPTLPTLASPLSSELTASRPLYTVGRYTTRHRGVRDSCDSGIDSMAGEENLSLSWGSCIIRE